MADGKGWPVVMKINLPPEEQYHSGHSLLIQGDSVDEVKERLAPLAGGEAQAEFVLLRFAEFALKGSVEQKLADGNDDAAPEAAPAKQTTTEEDEPASAALIKVVAKKTGKDADELKGISKAQAQALIKEAK